MTKKIFYGYIIACDVSFFYVLAPNCTITVQFSAKLCCFSLCPKRSANMLTKPWLMSCCLEWSSQQILMMCKPYISNIFPICWHVSGQHVIWWDQPTQHNANFSNEGLKLVSSYKLTRFLEEKGVV